MRIKFFLIFLAALNFACSEPKNTNPDIIPDPSVNLSIDIKSKKVDAAEGSLSLTVICNSLWTVSSNQSWVTLTPTSGEGNETITVSYSKNSGSSSRSAVITFSASGHTATLNLSQTATSTTSDPTKWLKFISSIAYESDGTTETSAIYYTYDSQGRETGFSQYSYGKLLSIRRDYVYNGKELTCYDDYYDNGILYSTSMLKIVFYDDYYWRKFTSIIYYKSDGVTETSAIYYTYDSQGRETGFSQYSYGKLLSIRRDYVYNGKELTCYDDFYDNGTLYSTSIRKAVFLDDYWLKCTSIITYESDGVTEVSATYYTYDSQGRETSRTAYYRGQLSLIQRDYVYNGKEQTYFSDSYSSGVLSSTTMYKMTYY